jgi:beta-phosphoglucomutase-like phosphatase (HAD superfamily)
MENIVDKYDIFCFDLDDTIVKTEKYHYQAWLETIQENIYKDFYITFEEYCSIFHSIKENNIQDYLINNLNITNYEDIIKIKNEIYYKIITENKNEFKMIKGCEELINKILKNNKKFIIVSNTLKVQIDFFSEIFPILKYSLKNYYREIIKNKKPNPECYLKVVEDFPNKKIVGFEDSVTGIHAITKVPDIFTYYINSPHYYHNEFILNNYSVIHINNYNELFII